MTAAHDPDQFPFTAFDMIPAWTSQTLAKQQATPCNQGNDGPSADDSVEPKQPVPDAPTPSIGRQTAAAVSIPAVKPRARKSRKKA